MTTDEFTDILAAAQLDKRDQAADSLTWPPIVRPENPLPSYVGEAEVTRAGRRGSLVAEITAYVGLHPGQCRGEIAAALGLEEYGCSKRLSDAKNLGLIRMAGETRYGARLQSRWYPVTPEPQQLRLA